jgi:hypothetical protein
MNISFLINYFEGLTTPLAGDPQYSTYLNIKQLRSRQDAIQKEKLQGCCGAGLNSRGKVELVILDEGRFGDLETEFAKNAAQILRLQDSLNRFDPIAKKAVEVGVPVPTQRGIESRRIELSNKLITKESIARSAADSEMIKYHTSAIKVSESPLVLELSTAISLLKNEVDALVALAEEGRAIV